MQAKKTIIDVVQELEAAVYEIMQSRPSIEQPAKKGLLGWVSKAQKSYTDTALQAVRDLCAQLPAVFDSYEKSSNKAMFALSNGKALMSIKSNLDALDKNTWVPKVVDGETLKLAQAIYYFAKNLDDNKDTVFAFLDCKTAQEVKYVLVDENKGFPKKLENDTIYIQKGEGSKINYCYVGYDGNVVEGTIPKVKLGAHQDQFADPDYFNANLRETSARFGTNRKPEAPLADLIYRVTQFYDNTQRGSVIEQIIEMRSNASNAISSATQKIETK